MTGGPLGWKVEYGYKSYDGQKEYAKPRNRITHSKRGYEVRRLEIYPTNITNSRNEAISIT